jgi:hypothetical protein
MFSHLMNFPDEKGIEMMSYYRTKAFELEYIIDYEPDQYTPEI